MQIIDKVRAQTSTVVVTTGTPDKILTECESKNLSSVQLRQRIKELQASKSKVK